MFLKLSHTRLNVYAETRAFCLECYRITSGFPSNEKYAMTQQIRRAALSVHLNLAEGSARKSATERSRFFEVSRSSVIEVDTCFDIAVDLKYVTPDEIRPLGDSLVKTFKMLTGMIKP